MLMTRELSPEEKRLIDREFAARQNIIARQRLFARRAFVIGTLSGMGFGAIRAFHVYTLMFPFLGIIWTICILIYINVLPIPPIISPIKDIDSNAHMNSCKKTSLNLSKRRTLIETFVLLTSPVLTHILFAFLK